MPKTKKLDPFVDLRKRMADLKAEMLEVGKVAFSDATKELFIQYPTLQAFSFTQYTPYFCDGDTCYFGVNADEPGLQFEDMDEIEHTYDVSKVEDYAKWHNGHAAPEHVVNHPFNANRELTNEMESAISEFVNAIEESVMEDMFGDHVEVIVHRDGSVDVEEYEHD